MNDMGEFIGPNELVELAVDSSKLRLNLTGAKIENLDLARIPILTEVTRADGKKAATHPCSPIFGPETNTSFGLSQHGPARNSQWRVTKLRKEAGNQEVEIETMIKEGNYPDGLLVSQEFRLGSKSLTLITKHSNGGTEPVPVNFGEHFYFFNASGWQGLKVNKAAVEDQVQMNDVIKLDEENHIEFPGGKKLYLKQRGLSYAVLWIGSRTLPNGKSIFDQNYVCIEPVEEDPKSDFFGSGESMIAPGEKRTTEIELKIE